MLRTLSLIAVLAAFAVPAFAMDATTTTTTTTTEKTATMMANPTPTTTEEAAKIAATTNSAMPASCHEIEKACRAAGFSSTNGANGKDLYKDCVGLIATGKAVQGVKFTADATACKTDLALAAPIPNAVTTEQHTSTTATTTTTAEPAALAPSAGTTVIEKTTTIPAAPIAGSTTTTIEHTTTVPAAIK